MDNLLPKQRAAMQVRHGAAVAQREVLRTHAASAAVVAPLAAAPSGAPSGPAYWLRWWLVWAPPYLFSGFQLSPRI